MSNLTDNLMIVGVGAGIIGGGAALLFGVVYIITTAFKWAWGS